MIHVFYRHYNVMGRESWRPTWFDYEKCFKNFINTLSGRTDVNLNIIYDGTDSDNFIFGYNYPIHRISAGSDYNSFIQTLNIIQTSNFQNDDIIYLLENDYLHLTSWIDNSISFFDEFPNEYLSLYDHNDKYLAGYENLKSKIVVTKKHHFRTTPSTCGSFLCKIKTLLDDLNYHIQTPEFLYRVSDIPVDHGKFLLLNLLKSREVYSPLPGLSTHCLIGLLSPTINWEILS